MKSSIKQFVKIFIVLFFANNVLAQQDAQYTQYMYNANVINPAYAGTENFFNITTLHRTQWLGLEGAPVTQAVNLNTTLPNTNFGLGLSVVNDNIGPSSEQLFNIDVSYRVRTSRDYTLAFGIKAGVNLLNVDFNKLDIYDSNDIEFIQNIENRYSPNAGVGIYYYSENFYTGLSSPNLLETTHYDSAQQSVASERATFYFTGGYVYEPNDDLKIKPAVLSKITGGAPIAIDFSLNFLYAERFTFGASYRLDSAVSAFLGLQISDTWMFGYSYDFDTNRLAQYQGGSHEVFLRINLNWLQDRRACKCYRFF